ncbi:RNA pseudouridine synthase [filamentous cyanobacterium CCP2]|nr:RNA pseudouridine synthase [filamentous cyanobacterium CCP2]
MVVHPLTEFIDVGDTTLSTPPSDWYEGRCPQTGEQLKLPRTAQAETIARQLMQQLAQDPGFAQEGKMYGILLVETATGDRTVLKAFSGLLNGKSHLEGWVPPIPGRDTVALAESQTLAALAAIKEELLTLQQLPEWQQYEHLKQHFATQLQALSKHHADRKQHRQHQRAELRQTLIGKALEVELTKLETESQQDGIERRNLKRQQAAQLQPLQATLDRASSRIQELKAQRKTLSRQLQTQLHSAYALTNFTGQTRSLQEIITNGSMPTGSGDCCAPKLLHYAATHHLKPIAMAEFWWGESANSDKKPGAFYGACAERCQPLMGFLLSGLLPSRPIASPTVSPDFSHALTILYEDEWLMVINKPAGLLSVPGRYADRQDSVLTRLQRAGWNGSESNGAEFIAVHRLDQDTSGILLIAHHTHVHRHLSQQFQHRQVHKVYEALLAGNVTVNQGTIELPLWGDPADRPIQKVDWQHGKPSQTYFQVISREKGNTRMEFIPLTGRTHQLRVHAADPQGLGIPILGDRLYGSNPTGTRLHLHARELHLTHPQSGQSLMFQCETPF